MFVGFIPRSLVLRSILYSSILKDRNWPTVLYPDCGLREMKVITDLKRVALKLLFCVNHQEKDLVASLSLWHQVLVLLECTGWLYRAKNGTKVKRSLVPFVARLKY